MSSLSTSFPAVRKKPRPARAEPLTPDAFAARFPDIQCLLNWSLFRAENWPIRRVTITERPALDRLFTAFRASRWRVYCSRWTPFTHPMRIAEVRARFASFPEHQKRITLEIGRRFAEASAPLAVAAPAYALPGGEIFLLDGNHRLSAVALADKPFRISLDVVEGPIHRRALPDLHYWCPPRGPLRAR